MIFVDDSGRMVFSIKSLETNTALLVNDKDPADILTVSIEAVSLRSWARRSHKPRFNNAMKRTVLIQLQNMDFVFILKQ